MRFPTTVLSDLNSKDDIDENTYVFSKFYGEDTTKWKCANDECKSPTEITGQDLKVLDNEDMVSWEKFGPLGIVVFPLCHHCGNSLSQVYIPIPKKKGKRKRLGFGYEQILSSRC